MTERSNQRIAYFNGKYVPEREAQVPFRDRSFLYGDGCFDMTRTFVRFLHTIGASLSHRRFRTAKYTALAPRKPVTTALRPL